MTQWEMVDVKTSWITVADEIVSELKENGLEIKEKHQGADNFCKYLEENEDIHNFLFKKFRAALTLNS